MYLKVKENQKDEKGGNVPKWYVIGNVHEVIYSWVKFEGYPNKIYEGCRLILSGKQEDLQYVRRMIVFHDVGKTKAEDCEEIYCDDEVYLCNDNGQTIERL